MRIDNIKLSIGDVDLTDHLRFVDVEVDADTLDMSGYVDLPASPVYASMEDWARVALSADQWAAFSEHFVFSDEPGEL